VTVIAAVIKAGVLVAIVRMRASAKALSVTA
jgi:hypothetical protein